MTLNITQIIDSEYKKRNLLKLLATIEPSPHFYVDVSVSTANRRKPLLAHIHAMMNQCAYKSGLDPAEMKTTLKGLYLCDIVRHTEPQFDAIIERFEKKGDVNLKGDVTGYAADMKDLFGRSVSLAQANIKTLRFFRQKVEAHLGSLEADKFFNPQETNE